MIFADASALIAVIAKEADGADLARSFAEGFPRLYSAMSLWETVSGLGRSYEMNVATAERYARDFLRVTEFEMVAIGEIECEIALRAYARYGRGRHPAALNMGDCFAYACAKSNQATLVYKGADFAQTDLG